MKKHYLFATLFSGIFLFSACNSSSDGDAIASEGKPAQTAATSNNSRVADCLKGFDYDYSKILTKEDVLKHAPSAQADQIEIKYDENAVKLIPEYGEVFYNWPSDRPEAQIHPSLPLKTADNNTVSLSKLEFKDGDIKSNLDMFHIAYKPMSEAEVEAGMKRLEEGFKDKPAKDLESAKKLMKRRGEMKNKAVEGVGDAAYWYPSVVNDFYFGSKLVVFAGNAQFEVVAKVSNDHEENMEVAKKIAQEILAKCK